LLPLFWRVGISGIGPGDAGRRVHTIDDKTGEVSSEVRITDNAGVLSGRIEKLLRKTPNRTMFAINARTT